MNSQDFVEALTRHVRGAAIEDTVANLQNPPGRGASPIQKDCSVWYNALSINEKALVEHIIASAAHLTLFGFLVVLDGSRTISEETGQFELAFAGDKRVVLNEPEAESLHDILNAVT